MKGAKQLTLLSGILLMLVHTANAQTGCDAGVRLRLAEALQVPANQLPGVTRDFSAGLFPGVTFFRAEVQGGFHSGRRAAGLVVVGRDSIPVRGIDDLPPVWRVVVASDSVVEEIVGLQVRELLVQVGVMGRGEIELPFSDAISPANRVFLNPSTDLSGIRSWQERVGERVVRLGFFTQGSDGITRYSAEIDGRTLKVTRDVIARRREN